LSDERLAAMAGVSSVKHENGEVLLYNRDVPATIGQTVLDPQLRALRGIGKSSRANPRRSSTGNAPRNVFPSILDRAGHCTD